MELYDVMRTTFSSREFTADPVPDALLAKILTMPALLRAGATARAGG